MRRDRIKDGSKQTRRLRGRYQEFTQNSEEETR
jgi:hypothetical protein